MFARSVCVHSGWFEMDQTSSTSVYVSGLPTDMDDDEFRQLMTKCGLVMFDPFTNKPKLKLYKDKEGQLKGDGLCVYIKVTLAILPFGFSQHSKNCCL